MANLVILESPAKANTVKGYLGSNYKVLASKGHVRDLPKSSLGIDVDNGFEPHYINIRGKGDVIKELKREAKSASKVFIATDPDREGEAIAWHIATQLGIPEGKACRVTFNEITKSVVKSAIKSPKPIDMDLVNSQQARRILDRLVGFNLSQVLWKHIGSGLSGGRVQSVATRIIVEREKEISEFIPKEYWTVDVQLQVGKDVIQAHYIGNAEGRVRLESEAQANEVVETVKKGKFNVICVKHAEKQKLPAPPFTTSTLQQEASKKLGFQSHKTMKIAQELYDGLNIGQHLGGIQGLITYMRTDSTRISDTAISSAREFIKENLGADHLPEAPRIYKSKNTAQDAHEAIRPSSVTIEPKDVKGVLSSDQYKLYKLIWERFIASQMEAAVLDTLTVDINNSGCMFKAGGQVVKFNGYMDLYDYSDDEDNLDNEHVDMAKLPEISEGSSPVASRIEKKQHFTEPPARYTEASLIKFLEENGIGRPSTYAPIISIIISRDYVRRDGKVLVGTKLGEITTDFIKDNFPEIADYEFTAAMENDLDSIENGKNTVEEVIGGFYKSFAKELDAAANLKTEKQLTKPDAPVSDYDCPKCGKKMVYKTGRFGKFLACPDYPTCRSTIAVDKDGNPVQPKTRELELAGFRCELCGGEMVVRSGKFGAFYACINYPKCKFTKQKVIDTGIPCPICGEGIVARQAREKSLFYSCKAYPECNFSTWDKPIAEKCPDCGEMLYYRRTRKSVICKNRGCEYKREEIMDED